MPPQSSSSYPLRAEVVAAASRWLLSVAILFPVPHFTCGGVSFWRKRLGHALGTPLSDAETSAAIIAIGAGVDGQDTSIRIAPTMRRAVELYPELYDSKPPAGFLFLEKRQPNRHVATEDGVL